MSNKLSKKFSNERLVIKVGARNSPLSHIQMLEVLDEIRVFHPHVDFDPQLVATTGDKNLQISLRTLNKSDFFTKEIDDLLFTKACRIGTHSAKDLPDPIPTGLCIVAVTKGIDSSDSLVLRPGDTIETLRSGAVIATSSARREEAVRKLRSDLSFIDLRGSIGQRLAKLDTGEADGVVVAEAALIRLGLYDLNRITLPGETSPGQGQLAVLARKNDQEMADLFASIDSRQTALYLGLEAPEESLFKKFHHFPIIKIIPRAHVIEKVGEYSHFIFTSKSTVKIFFEQVKSEQIQDKVVIAVGTKTAHALKKCGVMDCKVAERETAEGIAEFLGRMDLSNAFVCWPHSALSRSVLSDYFRENRIRFEDCVLYDTVPNLPGALPNKYDEIVFTSPSTIDAFLHYFGQFPADTTLTSIGPVTQQHLESKAKGKSQSILT